jgi:predicted dehydrogenase/threonine dehydrogenase-like Zn-dependent dehydrogenase
MHQVLIRRGKVVTEDVPSPVVSPDAALIHTAFSCISPGTELSNVRGSGKSLIQKALDQPDKIRQVLKMAVNDGFGRTWDKVQEKMDAPLPTGYSLSGTVLAVGKNVLDFQPGDRVAAAGAGQAHHAEFVDVPQNLIVKIPRDLDFSMASTVALGGIAMQGVRRLKPSLGEYVVVVGVGMVGQLAVQMLKLSGARVAALDMDDARLALSSKLGAEKCFNATKENAVSEIQRWTGGRGADAVLFCASTENPKALKQAFHMIRKKGRMVMVGVWGNEFDRNDIYEKEIDFLISTSYGPGRYDDQYEKKGLDYPYAYVRWTENRNMEEYLRLMSENKIDIAPLIQGTYPVTEADQAFTAFQHSQKKPVIVLLQYNESATRNDIVKCTNLFASKMTREIIRVGLIGAGDFASGIHLPNLKRMNALFQVTAVCNRTGNTAKSVAERFGASYATSDYHKIICDPDIDLVMICTRHRSHGQLVLESLEAGKHVFVEKPLCLTREELRKIESFFQKGATPTAQPLLMVGYNRRFSPYLQEIQKHTFTRQNPLLIHYRMNAGYIPSDHWVHTEEGGGRIVGEACHIVDLFTFLTGARLQTIHAQSLNPKTSFFSSRDNKAIIFSFEDGSVGVLDYFSVGSPDYPKEFMEIHFDQKSIVMDDYRSLRGFGLSLKELNSRTPSKGHQEEFAALSRALHDRDLPWPIPLWEMVQTTEVTFQIEEGDFDSIVQS